MIKAGLLMLVAMVLAALAGCGTLEVGIETTPLPSPSAQVATTPTSAVTSAPAVTPTHLPPTFTPTEPSPAPSATAAAERITFPVGGTTFAFTTRLVSAAAQRYVLAILAQQTMTITSGSNVTIRVLDASGDIVQASTSSPGLWEGTIPQNGDYTIVLVGQGFVTVTIEIPPRGS